MPLLRSEVGQQVRGCCPYRHQASSQALAAPLGQPVKQGGVMMTDRAEVAIAMVDEGRLIDWDNSLVVLEVSRELYEQFKEQKLNNDGELEDE